MYNDFYDEDFLLEKKDEDVVEREVETPKKKSSKKSSSKKSKPVEEEEISLVECIDTENDVWLGSDGNYYTSDGEEVEYEDAE